MKKAPYLLAILFLASHLALAGESGVQYVYQVSDGLGSGEPQLARIYCHDHYSHSGIPSFALISAPNIPPSNSPKPTEDHNILSASKILVLVTSEKPLIITIDASNASIPVSFGLKLPVILDLATKAVSQTAKEWSIKDYEIAIKRPPDIAQ